MLESDSSDFKLLSVIAVQLKKSSSKLFKSIAQKQIAPITLLTVMGFTGVSWLTTAAIAPQKVQAYTANVDVSLNRQTGESFQSFLRRAEAVARAAAQRSFDRDILVTQVLVTVVGQNDGAIVPVLSLAVSRQAWRNRPDPQRWATYFPNTQSLLRFDESETEEAGTQPAATPPPPPRPGVPVPGRRGPNAQPGTPTIIQIPGTPVQIQAPPGTPVTTPPTAPGSAPTPPPASNGSADTPGNGSGTPGTTPAPASNGSGTPGNGSGTPGNGSGTPGNGSAPASNGSSTPGTLPPPPAPGTPSQTNTTPGSSAPTTSSPSTTQPTNQPAGTTTNPF